MTLEADLRHYNDILAPATAQLRALAHWLRTEEGEPVLQAIIDAGGPGRAGLVCYADAILTLQTLVPEALDHLTEDP